MNKEGLFALNNKSPADTWVSIFVRANRWYYHDRANKISITDVPYTGNPDLSLVAPIILGSFKYDE